MVKTIHTRYSHCSECALLCCDRYQQRQCLSVPTQPVVVCESMDKWTCAFPLAMGHSVKNK